MNAYRDGLGKQCECAVPWPKCPHSWHIEGRHPQTGERYGISLNLHAKRKGLDKPKTRGEAEARQKAIIDGMANGTPQGRVTSGTVTFATAATAYVEEVIEPSEIEATTVAHVRSALARLGRTMVPDLGVAGTAALSAFTPDAVAALYRLTTKGFANSTKHKYRQALRGLLEWATGKGYLASVPVPATTKERGKQMPAGPDAMRTRRIAPAEEADLIEAARESRSDSAARMTALLTVAFDTGGRKGELLALQWGDLLWDDGVNGRVLFAAREKGARKNGEPRQVPMTERVRQVLRAMQTDPLTGKDWRATAYVFGDATGARITSIEKAWTTIRFRAHRLEPEWTEKNGLTPASQAVLDGLKLHFHDIRHECALRWHRERRWSLGTISNLLGHKDLTTLRVYLGMSAFDALDEAENSAAAMPTDGKTTVKRRRGQFRLVERKGA